MAWWKCKFCGWYSEDVPVPPRSGTCPSCKRMAALIRWNPAFPEKVIVVIDRDPATGSERTRVYTDRARAVQEFTSTTRSMSIIEADFMG